MKVRPILHCPAALIGYCLVYLTQKRGSRRLVWVMRRACKFAPPKTNEPAVVMQTQETLRDKRTQYRSIGQGRNLSKCLKGAKREGIKEKSG